jgi:transcriptional regulator with XRE-family HTH domain
MSPTVAQTARSKRKKANLTRDELAVKAGISSTTLDWVERAGAISPTTAAKLAKVLGCSAKELLP